jgi:5-formyltetrahydrofolate cyclo-ligase
VNLSEQKAALRRQVRAAITRLSQAERAAASEAACHRLTEQRIWQAARRVLLFSALNDELDLGALLSAGRSAGKLVALPRFVPAADTYEAALVNDPDRDLVPGRYGVCEPRAECPSVPANQLDFVLVPGVAFDAAGRRLGRGKGYYDRMLSALRGIKCGATFDVQVVPEIPHEPHDVRLDCLLTPTRWIEFERP